MSDTRVKGSSHLEQLKARAERGFGLVSDAETIEDLIRDVERASRFVIFPPEFMQMLRDIAASNEKHGPDGLHASLKIQGADPAWAELIEGQEDPVNFDRFKAEVAKITGYPLKSKLFRRLLKELKRIRRPARIPDEFMEVLEGIVEREKVREVEERAREAEAARLAGIEGADPEFTKRLVALARSEGLDVSESSDVKGLMERLRGLGNVHSGLRQRLRPFEAELQGEEPEPIEATTAAPDAVEGDDAEEPAGNSEQKPVEEAEPIPLYVKSFSTMKGIEWGDGERKGGIAYSSDVLMMSAYGYAIFGTRKAVNFGPPHDPGMSAFLLSDPISGMVSVGKFPYISSMEDALARIAAIQRITKEDLNRDPESVPAHTRKTSRFRTIEKLRSSTSPHEVELKRIGKQVRKLELSVEGFAAGAAFFSGRPGKKEYGAPPAQVVAMLGAIRSIGIGSVSMGMFFYPERGSSELLYGAEDGILRVGRRKLLDLDGNGAVDVDEILSLSSEIIGEIEGLTEDLKFVETIEAYHLPLAVGLWWDSLAQLRRKVKGVIRTASKKEGLAREKYLLNTYLKWHSMLPRGLNGSKESGKAGSGKGGGGKGFRGIARSRAPGRTETPEALVALHYEGDDAMLSVISGAAMNAGVLPFIAHAGAVVI